MGLTEWRCGLEVEGGDGNEKRCCGSFQLDRHMGDWSHYKSHVFELAITLLILYQNLCF